MKIFLALLLTGIVATTAAVITLQPGEQGVLECSGDELTIDRASITRALYSCIVHAPQPTPTPSGPYAGAPACPTHDPAILHTLWDEQRGAIVAMEQLLSEMQPEPQGEPEGGETDGPSNS